MKLTVLFMLIACFQVSAHVEAQNITYSRRNVSLEKTFMVIHDQTGYEFLYNTNMLQAAKKMDLHFNHTPLKTALNEIFSDQPFTYDIVGKTIVVKEKAIIRQSVTPPIILAKVQGKVVDSVTGQPLIGVTIQVKGSTIGTTTGVNGEFSLDAPEDAVLAISYLGYLGKEVPINGRNNIQIRLSAAATTLNQLVVVGYGTEKRSQLIGSVSQIDAKEINNRPVSQLSQVITGQMSGVTAMQNSGQPGGSGTNINILGVGSFGASTSPLILLDGIPVSSMDNINPNDVQSISVLKDASAAAIYGARAANGVILITTKSGSQSGKLKVSYNGYVSTQRATAYPKFVNSWQYAMLQNEAQPGSWTQAQIDSFKLGNDPDNYPNTHWANLVFKKGTLLTGHNISLSNSTENTDYFLSFGYLYQNGIVMKNNYNRYNIRLNMTNRISKSLTLTSHLVGEQDNDNEPAPPATLDFNDMLTTISQVIRFPSIYPNKLSNGYWDVGPVGKGTAVSYFDNASFFKSRETNLIANERLDWEIINGLKASLIGGYSEDNTTSQRFLANQTINAAIMLGPGNLTQANNGVIYKTLQELLQYNKDFNKNSFTLLLGHSFEDSYASSSTAFRSGYNSNQLTQLNAGDVSTQTNSGTASEWALNSYFGRLQYSFENKYLVEGDIRYDGSSRFPTDKKYAAFPAIAVGWRISQEKFIRDNNHFSWLNDLKLKASYGTLGNQNIGNYPYQSILSPGFNYTIGGNIAPGVAITTLADSLLHWESTRTKDVGIEGTILNNKLSFSATYFDKYTYDILVSPGSSVSQVLGFRVGPQNSGKLDNRGWEFTVEHNNKIGKFSYNISANLSIIQNKVLDLGVGDVKQPNGLVGNGSSLFVGYPVNIYYGYEANGLFVNQAEIDKAPNQSAVNPNPQPGDVIYKDINGPGGKPDGKITPAYDQTVLGSSFPKVTYGGNISVGYSNFDLSILLQGIAHVKGYLNNYAGWAFYNTANVQVWQMNDRWTTTNPNPHAKYPRMEILTNAGSPNTLLSSYWLLNGSYLRIKSVQLGYNIPQRLLKSVGITNLRVYADAENFLTWDHYPPGWDPEINTGGAYYPILANYTFGVNLSF